MEKDLQEVKLSMDKKVATEEDVKNLFELVLRAVDTVKGQINEKMTSQHGEHSTKASALTESLSTLEGKLLALGDKLTNTEFSINAGMDKAVVKIFEELQRIEAMIPEIPSFEPLQERITEVEKKIPQIPDELEAEDIRDKLEELEGEDRLDAKAIKNLPEMIRKSGGNGVGGAGIRSLSAGRNIAIDTNPFSPGISLNIPVSASAPSNPVENQLWIDSS